MNLDFANVKPSVMAWLTVGIMAVTFILVARYIFNRWPVPGFTPIFNSL